MLPFEDIPDDTVPVTAFLKVTSLFEKFGRISLYIWLRRYIAKIIVT